jgi:hypothetical protein
VNLKGKSATFYLSEEGKSFLSSVARDELYVFDVGNGQNGIVTADVEDSEDLGVWICVERKGESKFFLLRWEFILGAEIGEEKRKVFGLRG